MNVNYGRRCYQISVFNRDHLLRNHVWIDSLRCKVLRLIIIVIHLLLRHSDLWLVMHWLLVLDVLKFAFKKHQRKGLALAVNVTNILVASKVSQIHTMGW